MLACRVGRGGLGAAADGVRGFHRRRTVVAVVVGPEPTAALVVPVAASAAVAGRSTGLGSSHLHLRHHHCSQFQRGGGGR